MSDDRLRSLYKSNYAYAERLRRDKLDYTLGVSEEHDIVVIEAILCVVFPFKSLFLCLPHSSQLLEQRSAAIQSLLKSTRSVTPALISMAVDDASSGSSVPMYTGASHTGGIVSRSKFFAAAPLTDESDIIHLDDDKEEVQVIESDDELWGSFQPDEPTLVEDVPARSALAVPARRSTPALSSSFQLPPPEPFPYKPPARSPPVFAPAPLDSQSRSAGIHTTLGYDPKTDLLYPEVMNVLKTTYGLTSFRKNQLEAVLATLNGRDVFVLMPTGGGKSLCYQLPAICENGKTQGVTFVISPLIALMLDQVKELEEKYVDVVLFTGDMAADERIRATNRLNGQGEKPRLVYITPEKLQASDSMMKTMERLHAANELARFVIDEAHLVSTWGRDFRGSVCHSLLLQSALTQVLCLVVHQSGDSEKVISKRTHHGVNGFCHSLSSKRRRGPAWT